VIDLGSGVKGSQYLIPMGADGMDIIWMATMVIANGIMQDHLMEYCDRLSAKLSMT